MPDELALLFALHYRGRHLAADALWWLDHPDSAGPSSAPPPQESFLQAIQQLDETHDRAMVEALEVACFEVLKVDRRAALDALARARADAGGPRASDRGRPPRLAP